MAAAGGGGPRPQPVLEIYTQNGLEPYYMEPIGDGIHIFGTECRAPQGKYRVKLHSELIAFGVLHPVLGDPDFEFLKEMPVERSITMPHLNNDNFQFITVFDNHKMLERLKSIYAEKSAKVDSGDAMEYSERIRGMAYHPFCRIWAPEKRNDLNKISVAVARRVNSILREAAAAAAVAADMESNTELTPDEIKIPSVFEAGDDAAAAEEARRAAAAVLGGEDAVLGGEDAGQGRPGQGGGSRRPSRKYKKSKRVLRRKSRSTRRR
jgi:hypothetical protein